MESELGERSGHCIIAHPSIGTYSQSSKPAERGSLCCPKPISLSKGQVNWKALHLLMPHIQPEGRSETELSRSLSGQALWNRHSPQSMHWNRLFPSTSSTIVKASVTGKA